MFTSKIDKLVARSKTPVCFSHKILVPGYSDRPYAYQIFLQQENYAHDPCGMRSLLVLCKTMNVDLAAQYGRYYFLAGRKFLKLSVKEQQALLFARTVEAGDYEGAAKAVAFVQASTAQDIQERAADTHLYGDDPSSYAELHNWGYARINAISLYGKAGRRVVNKEDRLIRADANTAGAAANKVNRKAGVTFEASKKVDPTFKAMAKNYGKANKGVLKAIADAAKAEKKATKEAKKAAKAAAPADPLDAAAAEVIEPEVEIYAEPEAQAPVETAPVAVETAPVAPVEQPKTEPAPQETKPEEPKSENPAPTGNEDK